LIVHCSKIIRSYSIFYRATRVSSNCLESPNTLESKCKSSKRIRKNTYSIEVLLKENVFFFFRLHCTMCDRPISRLLFHIFTFRDATRSRYVLRIQYTIKISFVRCRQQSTSFRVNASNEK